MKLKINPDRVSLGKTGLLLLLIPLLALPACQGGGSRSSTRAQDHFDRGTVRGYNIETRRFE